MRKQYVSILFLLAICLSASVHVLAQSSTSTVFLAGTEGYNSFRIPAIVNLPRQQLLAFCEGRVNGAADFGDINIVMKSSKDQGRTWSSLKVVVDNKTLQAGNPAPVFDCLDPAYPNGRLFLFYNTGNNHESEIRKGKGVRAIWYISSVDAGENWSEPIDITQWVHRPLQPTINAHYNFVEDWRSYANTPGHAFQFQSGTYQGRLYIAANHSAGPPQKDFEDYQSHGFFTDDHGKTFHLSEALPIFGSNEATAAQISGDRLMLNARNQKGNIKTRIVAISKDGGQHWDSTYFDWQLPDPVCQGSLLNIGGKRGEHWLAFCNAADTVYRNKLTLRISKNEGRTWFKNWLIDSVNDSHQTNRSAYSDICLLNKKTMGVLYEKNNYSAIVFIAINWKNGKRKKAF